MVGDHGGNWRKLTRTNSGLPGDYISDVTGDAGGNTWFAVYGGGVARLGADGTTWKVWDSASCGLPNNYAGALAVVGDGTLWAACDTAVMEGRIYPGGLVHFLADGQVVVYPRPEDADCIHFMEVDRRGALWMLTGGQVMSQNPGRGDGMRMGASRFRGGIQTFFEQQWKSFPDVRLAVEAWYPHRLAVSRLGWEMEGERVWLLAKPPYPETPVNPATGLTGLGGLTGLPGLGGFGGLGMTFGFFPEDELVCYDGKTWGKQDGLPAYRPGELAVDSRRRKWLSLESMGDMVIGMGLACLEAGQPGAEWTIYNNDNGLGNNSVQSLTVDTHGRVWAASHMGDLACLDGEKWTIYASQTIGHDYQALNRAYEDGQGRLWFPSRSGVVVFSH